MQQGKSLVRFFLVLMALVCVYQFILMIPTRNVEKKAMEYAEVLAQQAKQADPAVDYRALAKLYYTQYIDSVSNETIFTIPFVTSFTYENLKQQQLALGLDLKGGMSVVMQIDLEELVLSLSNYSNDADFRAALTATRDIQRTQTINFISEFGSQYDRITNGQGRLATIFIRNQRMQDLINFESSNRDVLRVLRDEADQAVRLTYTRLRERIDKFGVTQPNVTLDPITDRILVELPGVENAERARNFLQASAQLEFWRVYRITDAGISQALQNANEALRRTVSNGRTVPADTAAMDTTFIETWDYVYDEDGEIIDSVLNIEPAVTADEDVLIDQLGMMEGPLFEIFSPNGTGPTGQLAFSSAVLGVANERDMNRVNELIAKPEFRNQFPQDIRFLWGSKPFISDNNERLYPLYTIKTERGSRNAPLEGDRVKDARADLNPQTNEYVVSLSMDNQGASIWGRMTREAAADNNREIAIVLDNEVVSAPFVREPITDGRSQISGGFSPQEARDLANILQIGKLPAKTQIISESVVGPTLGEQNIRTSITSLIIGFILVLIFMVLYYYGGGVISIIALFANLFFIFGSLASLGTVLTLPGIAGIVLTIGMAVDANVIIYERIREEIRDGKTLAASIRDGFYNSYSAIIDANVTTIMIAIILFYFGLGPIKGFAAVLIIGVLSSLFTAVLFTRLLIDYWTGKGRDLKFSAGWSENVLANINTDWLIKRKVTYAVSGGIILLGLGSFFIRGFETGVDFQGGYAYRIMFDEPQDLQAIRTALTPEFGIEPIVKTVGSNRSLEITTSYLIDQDGSDEMVMQALFNGISTIVPGLTYENFTNFDGDGNNIVSTNKIGPTIAEDIRESAVWSTIFALLFIFFYIFVRFRKWQYSMGAVAALFHDVLILLSVFTLFHGILPFSLTIDQAFIAALLTVIGYSINDTVVVFDRIREVVGLYRKGYTQKELVNMAVNKTLSRTIITSLTTLFVVTILFIFGAGAIKGFAFALMIGILVGTYSSIFVATPVFFDLSMKTELAKPADAAESGEKPETTRVKV